MHLICWRLTKFALQQSLQQSENCFVYPVWRLHLVPASTSLVHVQVLGTRDVPKLLRVQLARLRAGSTIQPHADKGRYATNGHRIHVPLALSASTLFLACPLYALSCAAAVLHWRAPALSTNAELPGCTTQLSVCCSGAIFAGTASYVTRCAG